MKILVVTSLSLFAFKALVAQTPTFTLQWDQRYGGDRDDAIGSMIVTSDSNLVLAGTSFSGVSGDKSEPNHDSSMQTADFWIVKTDSGGTKLWDKRFGGEQAEVLRTVIETQNGGFLAGGQSFSEAGGDKTEPNWDVTLQSNDFWIIKIDNAGNKQWDKRFGGTEFEIFGDMKQTSDGGFIICGSSFSGISGDKTQDTQGLWDYWVVHTDNSGVKIWDKRFGGADDDFAVAMDVTMDGGYIIGGYSKSGMSGDKSEPGQGNWDYWVIKIDDQGNKVWDKTIGGDNTDWLFDLVSLADGGFLLGGQSYSGATGDKSEPNHDPTPSGSDRWIVKIDSNGDKVWDRTYGATELEDLSTIHITSDGGFLISGDSYSQVSGDKTEPNLGQEQTWILKTDSMGNVEWDKTIFSWGHDEKGMAIQYDDLCFVSVNYTTADTGGYKSQMTQGNGDYWMVKICIDDATSLGENIAHGGNFYITPNPASDWLYIKGPGNLTEKVRMEIVDMKGKSHMIINDYSGNKAWDKIDISDLSDGMYLVKINTGVKIEVLKFVVVK